MIPSNPFRAAIWAIVLLGLAGCDGRTSLGVSGGLGSGTSGTTPAIAALSFGAQTRGDGGDIAATLDDCRTNVTIGIQTKTAQQWGQAANAAARAYADTVENAYRDHVADAAERAAMDNAAAAYSDARRSAYNAAIACGKIVDSGPSTPRPWMSTWWLISSP